VLYLNLLIVLAVLLAATIGGAAYVWWLQRRPSPQVEHEVVQPHRLGADGLGETATLLQFSTQRCAKCPGAHRTLAELARERDGVRHLDIDLTHRPDIARHFRVLQTPTTLILDADGAIQTRFGGVPSRDVVELELARLGAGEQDAAA
jgi:thiol-disulfide isomerase/thioredoxin